MCSTLPRFLFKFSINCQVYLVKFTEILINKLSSPPFRGFDENIYCEVDLADVGHERGSRARAKVEDKRSAGSVQGGEIVPRFDL